MFKILLAGFLLACSQLSSAAFLHDDGYMDSSTDIGKYLFNVTQESSVSLWEKSSDDYRLSLFDGDGLMIFQNDDNKSHPGQNGLDAALNNIILDVGNYTATITYWTNWGNIGDTIVQAFDSGIGSTNSRYVGDYDLYVRGDYVAEGHVQNSTVPEPDSLLLFAAAFVAYFISRRDRNSLLQVA